MEQQQLG